jgi:hypothetical protein
MEDHMTQTAPAPEAVGTELAPVAAARRVLAKPGVTLLDVLQAIAGESLAKAPEVAPAKPKIKELAPKPIVLPQTLVDAIGRFIDEVKAVQGELPEKRAKLTQRQRGALGKLYRSTKLIQNETKKLIDNTIRVAWFNHFDVMADQTDDFDADAATRDGKGFYLVAAEEDVPEVGTVKRELSAGTPSLDFEVIKAAVVAGRLPSAVINGISRPTRVLDEEKAVTWFAKNPQYVDVLSEATVVTGASGSLQLR